MRFVGDACVAVDFGGSESVTHDSNKTPKSTDEKLLLGEKKNDAGRHPWIDSFHPSQRPGFESITN